MLEAIFNPENAVFCLMNKMLDLMVLSLVWALCCIPIITAGAASAALYHAVVKSVRRRSFEFFRANLDSMSIRVIPFSSVTRVNMGTMSDCVRIISHSSCT